MGRRRRLTDAEALAYWRALGLIPGPPPKPKLRPRGRPFTKANAAEFGRRGGLAKACGCGCGIERRIEKLECLGRQVQAAIRRCERTLTPRALTAWEREPGGGRVLTMAYAFGLESWRGRRYRRGSYRGRPFTSSVAAELGRFGGLRASANFRARMNHKILSLALLEDRIQGAAQAARSELAAIRRITPRHTATEHARARPSEALSCAAKR